MKKKMVVAGYEITLKEMYSPNNSILFGVHSNGSQFATWDYNPWAGAFWGHYFFSEEEAKADYHKRLAEEYERLK